MTVPPKTPENLADLERAIVLLGARAKGPHQAPPRGARQPGGRLPRCRGRHQLEGVAQAPARRRVLLLGVVECDGVGRTLVRVSRHCLDSDRPPGSLSLKTILVHLAFSRTVRTLKEPRAQRPPAQDTLIGDQRSQRGQELSLLPVCFSARFRFTQRQSAGIARTVSPPVTWTAYAETQASIGSSMVGVTLGPAVALRREGPIPPAEPPATSSVVATEVAFGT